MLVSPPLASPGYTWVLGTALEQIEHLLQEPVAQLLRDDAKLQLGSLRVMHVDKAGAAIFGMEVYGYQPPFEGELLRAILEGRRSGRMNGDFSLNVSESAPCNNVPPKQWTTLANRLSMRPQTLRDALPDNVISFRIQGREAVDVQNDDCGLALNLVHHPDTLSTRRFIASGIGLTGTVPPGRPGAGEKISIGFDAVLETTPGAISRLVGEGAPFDAIDLYTKAAGFSSVRDQIKRGRMPSRYGGGYIVEGVSRNAFHLGAEKAFRSVLQAAPDSSEGFDFSQAPQCLREPCPWSSGKLRDKLRAALAREVAPFGFRVRGAAIPSGQVGDKKLLSTAPAIVEGDEAFVETALEQVAYRSAEAGY